MNAEVAYAYRERKVEAEPLGEKAYHLHALQHLKLKTVVKVGCHQRLILQHFGIHTYTNYIVVSTKV